MGERSSGEDVTPEEAFRLLGNETRMAILRALWEHQDLEEYTLTGATPVPFSTLQEWTEVDDSGNFNYHLGELVGTLVTEREQGYALSKVGAELVRALEVGTSFEAERIEPTRLSDPCPFCGGTLLGSYDDEHVTVECDDCVGLEADGIVYKGRIPPPSTDGRTIEELVEAELARYVAFDTLAEEGVCPACSATVETSLRACEGHRPDDGLCPECGRRFGTHRGAECTVCGAKSWSPALTYLTDVPAVRSFFAERGIDTGRSLSWQFFLALNESAEETIVAVEPVTVEYAFAVEGDELVATIETRPDGRPVVEVDHPD